MTEAEYFLDLEKRVCRELEGMRNPQLRKWWCDGFIPEEFIADGSRGRITGRAWVCDGPKQACWDFVLVLNTPALNRDEIDWSMMTPAEDATGWLSMDFAKKLLTVNPAAARADQAAGD